MMSSSASPRASRRAGGQSHYGLPAMVPLGDLALNPVEIEVDDNGSTWRVTVSRLKGANARVSCQCDLFVTEHWCRHCVEVLCLGKSVANSRDPRVGSGLKQIVTGLPLAADARHLAAAQQVFSEALEKFDAERPDGIDGEMLGKFTELVSGVAAASAELEDSVGSFRRRMDAWRKLPASSMQPDQ